MNCPLTCKKITLKTCMNICGSPCKELKEKSIDKLSEEVTK